MKKLNELWFKQIVYAMALLLILPMAISCKKEEKLPPGKLVREESLGQAISVYPHSSSFGKTSEHGQEFLQNGSSCRTCHGENLDGGSTKVSCNSCHNTYPHTKDFVKTTLHGTKFLENRNQCIKCHGSDFSGGDTKVACMDCHNYPHDKSWAQPTKHGAEFLEVSAREASVKDPTKRKLTECMMCHQNKVDPAGTFKERHPEQFVSCSSCHVDMPHGMNFLPFPGQTKAVPHRTYIKAYPGLAGQCFSCHINPERSAPKPETTCRECHDTIPVPWPEAAPEQ